MGFVKLKFLPLTVALALAIVGMPMVTAADSRFERGIRAYIAGDVEGAKAAWLPLAEAGDPRAMFHLGELYLSPSGGSEAEQAPGDAILWFRRAAELNYRPAQTALGLAYESGNGVEADAHLAAMWWQMAADNGDSRAEYFLAGLYETGRGVGKSIPTAKYYYESAASKGDLRAQAALDVLNAVRQDTAAALKPRALPGIDAPLDSEKSAPAEPRRVAPQTAANEQPEQVDPPKATGDTAPAKAKSSRKLISADERIVPSSIILPAGGDAAAANNGEPDAPPAPSTASAEQPQPTAKTTAAGSDQSVFETVNRYAPKVSDAESQPAPASDSDADASVATAAAAQDAAVADDAVANVEQSASKAVESESSPPTSDTTKTTPAVETPLADSAADSVETAGSEESVTAATTTSADTQAQADAEDSATAVAAIAESESSDKSRSDVVDWIAATPEGHYTIQLFVTGEESAAKEFIDTYNLADAKYYYHKSATSGWYKIIFGRYTSAEQAREERSKFPAAVQRYSPWIRSFDSIRKELGVQQSSAATPAIRAGDDTPTSPSIQQSQSASTPQSVVSTQTPAPAVAPTIPAPATPTKEPALTEANKIPASAAVERDLAAPSQTAANDEPIAIPATAALVAPSANLPASTQSSEVEQPLRDMQAASVIQPIGADGKSVAAATPPPRVTDTVNLALHDEIAKVAYRNGQRAFNARDYDNAFTLWQPLADNGYADAQYGIGFMYEAGWGVPENLERAHYWYTAAAQQGYAKAQYQLGMLYLNGSGVPNDESIAMYWIQSAADQSDARASEELIKIRARTAQR